ncbi:MAG: serine/threonine protein kinase [Polyangiaceae bacterium]|nr:serine/threonine protein kinase [Polyangiaceae bacterium]
MGFLPGAMIGGKYRLERKIAEGGVGEVWIAIDQKSRRVAIKRLLPETAKDRELVARFRREAVLLGKLHSEHVSQVIEQITDPKFGLLLVMEFVDGESLADLLDRRRRLPVPEVIAIGIDIARAIGVLHEANIIHRDLKPENVIMRRLPGGAAKAVLIDFGFARLDPHGQGKRPNDEALTGITRADTMLGTVAYMAPEQVLNSRDVGRAADVYALGAILYRAMSGRHAFGDVDDVAYARAKLDGEAPPLIADRSSPVAAAVAKIIMRALKRRPVERYDRIEMMLKELVAVRDEPPMSDDGDAPTQNAPIAALLGSDGTNPSQPGNDGATSQTERVVVNLPAPDPPAPAAASTSPDESSVTRPRQPAGVRTIPIPTANPLAPPPPPLAPAPAAIPAAPLPPPSLRLAPPPVPPKLAPAAPAPGVDDDVPAYLRNTSRNRAVGQGQTVPLLGGDDDIPVHLRQTSPARGIPAPQLPAPMAETKKPASSGISFGAALISMAITLIAGFVAGWIVHASLSGHSPWEVPAARTPKR